MAEDSNSIDLDQAIALIEAYIGAGDHAKARIVLDKVLPVLGRGVETLQDPGRISFNSGMAYIYLKLNRSELGADYGQLALLNDPADALAHALLTEEQKIHIARSLMHHRRAASAVIIFSLVHEMQGSKEAAYYLSLMGHFDELRAEIEALPEVRAFDEAKQPLLMNAIVWGASYVESMLTYTFPSLMAPGNIPHLARERRVIIDLFTTEADRDLIRSSAVGKAVMSLASLRFNIIPDTLLSAIREKSIANFDRWLIAGSQQVSALRAHRIGADLTFISSAGVYSANCFAAAAGFIEEGYQAVLTGPPRAMEPEPLGHLKDYAKISNGVIDVDEKSLTRFIIDNLHPHCRNCFIATQPKFVFQSPVSLFFKNPSGYSSRTFQTSPMLISNKLLCNDFAFDYLTVDARFVAELTRGKPLDGLLRVISNPSEELVVTEVDTQSGPGMKTYQGIEVSIKNSATAALSTVLRESDLAFYEWALRQPFEYRAEGISDTLPDSDLDETQTVEKLIALIREGGKNTLKSLQIYENAPIFPA